MTTPQKTTVQILIDAEQSGILKLMLSKGLISASVIRQREIYFRVLMHIGDVNNPTCSVPQAILNTTDDLKISERMAWRAWSAMRK